MAGVAVCDVWLEVFRLSKLWLFFWGVLFVFSVGWFVAKNVNERKLLRSKKYADAVADWEKVQAWFVRDFQSDFVPFSILVDTGGLVVREIRVRVDEDGKIFLPSDLSPAEFVVAVCYLKEHFGVDG